MNPGRSVGRLWADQLLPRIIEFTCSDRMTGRWRAQAFASVGGDVLEIGFGSGTNLAHYRTAVERVYAVEPADLAWRRAAPAVEAFGRPVERVGLDGAAVSLPEASVDAVVSAYTMCTIPDLDGALAEVRRVLRPGGSLYFIEHGLALDESVAARQRRLQPFWGKVAGGCHLDRDVPALIAEAGFDVAELDSFWTPGPALTRPMNWQSIGRATPR